MTLLDNAYTSKNEIDNFYLPAVKQEITEIPEDAGNSNVQRILSNMLLSSDTNDDNIT